MSEAVDQMPAVVLWPRERVVTAETLQRVVNVVAAWSGRDKAEISDGVHAAVTDLIRTLKALEKK